MATWQFPPTPAVNPSTGEFAPNSSGIIYGSLTDAQNDTNPLPLTDASGVSRSSTVDTSSIGLTEEFYAGQMQVWWKCSDIIQQLTSPGVAVANVGAQAAAEAAQTAAEGAQSAAEQARDSANNSAQAAQAAAATANKPANDAIDDHLGGDATGLVPRVSALEAGGGSGVGVGGVAMIEQDGQLPVSWDSNMQPTYGTGTPMRPTASRTVQVPWLLTTLTPSDVPIIDSGTGGFMRGVDIMQVAQS